MNMNNLYHDTQYFIYNIYYMQIMTYTYHSICTIYVRIYSHSIDEGHEIWRYLNAILSSIDEWYVEWRYEWIYTSSIDET